MNRYRILFAKTEAMRFTGHLDLFRAWERLLRRAQTPLAYSSGFHPHPKIQIGAALPLGVTGENELVDIETTAECAPESLTRDLDAHAPPGIRALRVDALPAGTPGLEKLIVAGDYSAEPLDGVWPPDLAQRIGRLMAADSLSRERRGKTYDLRPRILSLGLDENIIQMRLSLTQEATGRPDEVLAALGLADMPVIVKRAMLVVRSDKDGQ